MKRTNMTMSLDDSKSNFQSTTVWGELAIISSSGAEKQSMVLDKCEYTIGRSRRCDVRISIKTVSRIHVRIKYDKLTGIMTLFNCGSEEDLFVNGTYVKSKEEVSLAYGDIINLSGRRFKLQHPRDERSVIVDETQLCSQPAILDKSASGQLIPGGGIRDSKSIWQRGDLLKTKETRDSSIIEKQTKVDASPFGRVFGYRGSVENSPVCRMSNAALGTSGAESNTKTSKSVRFSYFNEIKTNGQKVYSPARKRRRLSDRMPTPGPRGFGSTRQQPQPLNRNISSKKRMSYQKQAINRTRYGADFENKGKQQQVKTKLLLTPTVKGRTLDERRKAIMRRLLADDEVTNALPKFHL